jgi:Spy/CpxP family protein refolding chaperone
MRTLGKCILVFGLLAVGGTSARSADPEKVVPREGAVQLMLLRQQSVQDDLKLTKEQADKIHTFADKQWAKAQEIHKTGGDKAKSEFEALGKANEKFISETLKPEQQKRLDQISMHIAGLLWVLDPKVSKALNITDAQRTKIEEMHKAAHKETEDVIHTTDKAAREAKLKELRKVHHKQLLEILTDDQKTKWKELAGPPFTGELHFVSPDDKK